MDPTFICFSPAEQLNCVATTAGVVSSRFVRQNVCDCARRRMGLTFASCFGAVALWILLATRALLAITFGRQPGSTEEELCSASRSELAVPSERGGWLAGARHRASRCRHRLTWAAAGSGRTLRAAVWQS